MISILFFQLGTFMFISINILLLSWLFPVDNSQKKQQKPKKN